MISNKKQLGVSNSRLADFNTLLQEAENRKDWPSERKSKMTIGNLQYMKKQIEDEIKEYEDLQARRISSIELQNVTKLPEVLIKSRIYRGWTQQELGEKLGLSAQQIQRYEKQLFMSTNLERVINLFHALEIDIHTNINLTGVHPEIFVSNFENEMTPDKAYPTFEQDEDIIKEETGLKIQKNRRSLRNKCGQTQGLAA